MKIKDVERGYWARGDHVLAMALVHSRTGEEPAKCREALKRDAFVHAKVEADREFYMRGLWA